MDKDSVLYLLMDMRVNGILDRILEKDEEYQEIARKSGEYLDRLEAMELPQEARSLIDLHSCEQNALGARYGALAYLLGFSDCVELMPSCVQRCSGSPWLLAMPLAQPSLWEITTPSASGSRLYFSQSMANSSTAVS